MSSSTTKVSLSMDALVKPVRVVDNRNNDTTSRVGAMLFVCGDAGDCLGFYALDEANATSEREPELKLVYQRHIDQGLPVSDMHAILLYHRLLGGDCARLVCFSSWHQSSKSLVVPAAFEFNVDVDSVVFFGRCITAAFSLFC